MQETKELEQINFEEKIVKAKELLEKLSNPQITLRIQSKYIKQV